MAVEEEMDNEMNVANQTFALHCNAKVYVLRNTVGSTVRLTNLGARIMGVIVPDRHGNMDNVVLGFENTDQYLSDNCYLGATIGPVANRISNARFNLDGSTYVVDANDGVNSNHGGFSGIDMRLFDCLSADDKQVIFAVDTKDGDGGFPGDLHIEVSYKFGDDNMLRIEYFATTTKKTILNLTNHAYFNLSGCRNTAMDSQLQIVSSVMVESDANYIPTGELIATANSRHDFSTLSAIIGTGYNDYHILAHSDDGQPASTIFEPNSGRTLDLYTSYPGLFFYSADFLSSSAIGVHGRKYEPFDGLCLEAQLFPDAINQSGFPSVVLDKECEYRHYIAFHFHT